MIRNLDITQPVGTSSAGGRATPTPSPDRRKPAAAGELVFGLVVAAALFWGWSNRGSHPDAESGIGYYFGFAGALLMLALLAYPLRKHAPFLRKAGPVSLWFRTHMAFGLIGPTLILYHANFSLGSVNSNIALYSMLTVAASGLVGRYIYSKIHKGLYGARAEMRSISAEAEHLRRLISEDIDDGFGKRLDALEGKTFGESDGIAGAVYKSVTLTALARQLRGALNRKLNSAMRGLPRGDSGRQTIAGHKILAKRYFQQIEQAAEFELYDRLFSAWHLLHLPLFILLILTAIVHVVAVHLY